VSSRDVLDRIGKVTWPSESRPISARLGDAPFHGSLPPSPLVSAATAAPVLANGGEQ
jgi:hypothetical protein